MARRLRGRGALWLTGYLSVPVDKLKDLRYVLKKVACYGFVFFTKHMICSCLSK